MYSWYLDLAAANWSALVLNDYEVVLPLPVRSKFYIHYLLQPIFLRYLEIFSEQHITKQTEALFWDHIPSKIKLIDIYYSNAFPHQNGVYETAERSYQLLDLNKSYAEIYHEYGSSIIKNLKKAEKAGLSIGENISSKEIIDFYRENVGSKIKEFDASQYLLMEKLMEKAIAKEQAFTFYASDKNNKITASVFILRSKNELYFFKGSACADGKASGAMYLLLDHIFKCYSQKGLSFNFAGSSIEGVANFNRSFGAKDCVYLQVKKNKLPKLVNLIKSLKK